MSRRLFSIILLSLVVLALILFRASRQRLKIFCDESLKSKVLNVLQEQSMKYEFTERSRADLVVDESEIVYKGNIYKLFWEEALSEKIEELLRFCFDGAQIQRLSKGFLSERYRIIFQGVEHTIEVRVAGENLLQAVIKSILTRQDSFFENGFFVARMEVILDGEKRIFFYEPGTDQVFFEDAGGR